MLPIASAPSALARLSRPSTELLVHKSVATQEPLSGEWQRAHKSKKTDQRHTLEGEVVVDFAAVSSYLAAAGELTETVVGVKISVYA